MRVAFFAHDLSDAAVARRVLMLQAGGAEVTLIGFRRGAEPVERVAGVTPIDLGRTRDARLITRIGSVLGALARAPVWSRRLAGADAILARNLEMLVLACVARALAARHASLAYEVLDLHRLMLGAGAASRSLRALERTLMRGVSTLITSSPAYFSAYFEPRGLMRRSNLLVEDKVLSLDGPPVQAAPRPPGPPWRIGWYGMVRCRRSLDILTALARQAPGLVEVEIRGRPAYTEFDDFDAQVAAAPGVSFHGPYDPAELPGLYAGVHFAWAVDYFNVGLNSALTLATRLYEGQLHGAVPIAQRGVEIGQWLARRDAGLLLDDPERELVPILAALGAASYAALARKTAQVPIEDLVCGRRDCEVLVRTLRPTARA